MTSSVMIESYLWRVRASRLVGLLGLWFGYMRRHFPGPAKEVVLALDEPERDEAYPAV